MQPNGAVLYTGPSLLDGAPIVVIATGLEDASSNRKTGAMVQTYILRQDVSPTEAVKSGADESICGDCVHRGRPLSGRLEPGQVISRAMEGRTCYVNVGQGPLGVWRAWQRGIYTTGIPDCTGKLVRLGTYGDPAAVPVTVWLDLLRGVPAKNRTGYTHQWRRAPQLRTLCMASADSIADAEAAEAAGWRTFRVAKPCDPLARPNEAVCPASAEAGKKLTCATCMACNGAQGRRGSIVIQAHGGFAVMANVNLGGIRPYFARSL